ncbi:MAG: glycosyltransferase, partial [Candidatus Levyibacteriota bacterium]
FCFVGRMARQKGLDMLVKVAKRIVELDANLVILGSGSPNIEKSVKKLEQKYPQNIRAEILYSEELAHKIYAGSDFIIIPSRYEPCGLIQMIAMSYGTLPIASKTGGLKDTIKNNSTGFLFEPGHVVGLRKKIKKAVSIVKSDKKKHERMVERAMNADFSWRKSARIYKKLYQEML